MTSDVIDSPTPHGRVSARRQPEQSQIRGRPTKRRLRVRLQLFVKICRRLPKRIHSITQPIPHRTELGPVRCPDVVDGLPQFRNIALDDLAVRKRQFPRHQIDRLDPVGALVDRQDPRIAIILRRAGLFDEAHPAMNLDPD